VLQSDSKRLVDVLCSGVDAEYDQAISDIQSVEQALRDYLDQQKKVLGCRVNDCYVAQLCGRGRMKKEVQ